MCFTVYVVYIPFIVSLVTVNGWLIIILNIYIYHPKLAHTVDIACVRSSDIYKRYLHCRYRYNQIVIILLHHQLMTSQGFDITDNTADNAMTSQS